MQKVEMILEYEYSIQRAVCMQRACMCARLHKGVQFVPSKSACLHAGLLDCFLDDQQYHGQAFTCKSCVALRWVYVHYIMDTSYMGSVLYVEVAFVPCVDVVAFVLLARCLETGRRTTLVIYASYTTHLG